MVIAMHHLMGTAEIARRLGVSRQRVQQLVARPDFPKPTSELDMGKVWESADIEAWIRVNRPDRAAPPKAERRPVRRGRGRWHPEESPNPTPPDD